VDYDPEWPHRFLQEAGKIQSALGERALRIEHVRSTSVAELPAKPIIDIVLAVADSGREDEYVELLEKAGYPLRIREPDWHQHRMFKGPENKTNLHVFSEGCPEIDRMLIFRDWLRASESDRELYARSKCAGTAGVEIHSELRGCEDTCYLRHHVPSPYDMPRSC
jgi:GrpB-like predicted nucleotidyltransferase (UPF0157 family)